MLPHLIFKCPYIRGGSKKVAAHLSNYVRYMATREGAQRIAADKAQLPATKKQQQMVEQLLRDFPLSRGTFEYEDYAAAPTRGNAQTSSHGRWRTTTMRRRKKKTTSVTSPAVPAPSVRAPMPFSPARMSRRPCPRWRRRLHTTPAMCGSQSFPCGGRTPPGWATTTRSGGKACLPDTPWRLPRPMKIPWDQFRWYAASTTSPTILTSTWSATARMERRYLTKQGIADIKSGLAKEIFQNDLTELYQQQTQRRGRAEPGCPRGDAGGCSSAWRRERLTIHV